MGVIAAVTNPQMGVSCMDGNGFHTQKLYYYLPSPSGFCFKFRPKSNQQLRMRRVICGSKGGGDSSGLADFEFKPSFQDYLKVMESVKTDRDSNQAVPSIGSTPNRSQGDNGKKLRVPELQISGARGVSGGEIGSRNGVKRNLMDDRKVISWERDNAGGESVKSTSNRSQGDKGKLRIPELQISGEGGVTRSEISSSNGGKRKLKDAQKVTYGERVNAGGEIVRSTPNRSQGEKGRLRVPQLQISGQEGFAGAEISSSNGVKTKLIDAWKVTSGERVNAGGEIVRSTPNWSQGDKGRLRVPQLQISCEEGVAGDEINSSNGVKRKLLDARKVTSVERVNAGGELEVIRVKGKLGVDGNLVKTQGQTRYVEYDEPRVKGKLGVDTNLVKKGGRSRNAEYDEPWVKRKVGVDTNFNLMKRQVQSRNDEYDEPSFTTNRQRSVISSRPSGNYANHFGQKGIAENREGVNDVKSYRSSKKIVQYNSDDDIIEERAAFKSLKGLDDPYDKPRVSRVDMEERIQKLAKCLNGTDIDMPEWIFSKMIRSAKIRFSDHSVLRLIQILGKYGNWRRVLQVVEWFQKEERFKSHKIRYIYTAAIDALGKARRPTEALNLFNAMKQQMSSYPDLVAYRSIAVTLGQAGYMKELFDVIDGMRSLPEKKFKTVVHQKWDPRLEPDIIVYNAVLNACVRRKNWEGGFWVLQQLKQQGLHPSSSTYGLVMEVMFACEKYELVHDFFKKVQKSYIPNALTYKVLVNTLWKQGNVDDAVLAVQDMERRGIVGSAGLYYDLARCLCSAGRCQEAIMQIDKMCKVANKPLVVTYTGLIQACLDYGKIESAIFIFNHMLNICPPNLVTYNIMLKGYLDSELYEEAKQLFQKLLENGNHFRSKEDYRERVIPDIYTFNLMLDACAGKNHWDDLVYAYEKMLQHGFHFNAKRHLRIVMDACRTGKVELLETTWKHLGQTGQLPPPPLIKEMFRLKLELGDFAAAISCISSIPLNESHKYSPKLWLSYFRENANFFRKDVLVRLEQEVSTLISRSDSASLIFRNLLTSCKEFLRTEKTVAVVDQIETASSVCRT